MRKTRPSAGAVVPSRLRHRSIHRGWHLRPGSRLYRRREPFPGSPSDHPAPQGCGVEPQATTAPTQRDQHLLAIESEGRCGWKRTSGYYAQSHAENVFRDSNGHSATGYGRSGMSLRSGKPRWRASCSIGCGNWVVLSPMRSAERGVQETTSPVARFMQQRLATAEQMSHVSDLVAEHLADIAFHRALAEVFGERDTSRARVDRFRHGQRGRIERIRQRVGVISIPACAANSRQVSATLRPSGPTTERGVQPNGRRSPGACR